MKKILSLIVVVLFYTSCSTTCINSYKIINKNGKVYKKGSNTPYTGGVKYKKDREYYKNGIPTGKWVAFYGNGKLKSIENWKEGQLNGKYILYNNQGNKVFQTYYVNGKENGKFRLYYENGKPQIYGQFKNGKVIGIWYHYDKNGKLINKIDYSNNGQIFDQKS